MLRSYLVELGPCGPPNGSYAGHHAHAWFLESVRAIDPMLSDVLHASGRRKPFTLWSGPCFDLHTRGAPTRERSERHWLRITTLEPALGATVERLAQSMREIHLGGCSFRPGSVAVDRRRHPWAGAETFPAFRRRIVDARPAGGRVTLRFLTPTAFSGANGNTLFPAAGLVFRSLVERWNTYADARIPDYVARELLAGVREEAYRLRTVPLAFDGYRLKGCTGTCEYSIGSDAGAETRVALHLLADFAFYAGVGVKTTMGMGQVIPERNGSR